MLTTTSIDPLQHRFGGDIHLPRGFKEEARGMDWELFTTIYSPTPSVRITQLQQWGENFHAELICSSKAHPTRHLHREVRAHGPISACTQFLGDLGRYVEIQSFHQREIFSATVTMLKVRHQYLRKTAWAIGFGANPENSIATAMSCAAERIHS